MTGGQISPTSPKGSFGTTAPYGSRDMPFNLAELVSAAGASYVARWTTTHPLQLSKAIQKGLENEGFSFIEVVSQCPTYFGRKNKMKTPLQMFQWIKENSINKRRAEKMDEAELEGKIIVGEFANNPHAELTDNIKALAEENSDKPLAIKSAFEELD